MIILLYTFLVISFGGYKEFMICLIAFSKFSDMLPVQELLVIFEEFA